MSLQGLTGEAEVMDILRKHEESAGSGGGSSKRTPTGSLGSLDEMKESIMKVIRTHIEQNKLPYNQEGAGGIGVGGGVGDTSSYLINAAAGNAIGSSSRKKYSK